METAFDTLKPQAYARAEFEAHVKAALALAQQLKGKLIQWGEQMERDRAGA